MHPRQLALLAAWALVDAAPVSPASAATWTYLGLDGIQATGIRYDPAGDRLLVSTHEGFHVYHFASDSWTEHDEEGWIGRYVGAIWAHRSRPSRVITARVNGFGEGYLEVSDTFDEFGTIVYTSVSGLIGGVVDSFDDPDRIYAAIAPEFLTSTDGGDAWTATSGIGHGRITDIGVSESGRIFVSGDGGVVTSADGGVSWEPFADGLPQGEEAVDLAVSRFDDDSQREGMILTATASGIFKSFSDAEDPWEVVSTEIARNLAISPPVLVPGTDRSPFPLGVAATPDGRVLIAPTLVEFFDDTGDLPGAALDVAYILRGSGPAGVFVVTETSGVYVGSDIVAVPPVARALPLALRVSPNPFRSRVAIDYELPDAAPVVVTVFDVFGRFVVRLIDEVQDPGAQRVWLKADHRSAGVYFVRIEAAERRATRSVTLTR